jgi:hypothetical protein
MAEDRRENRQHIESLTAQFLARGGRIETCPPGPSENVVYKNRPTRRRAADAPKTAAGNPSSEDKLAPDTAQADQEQTPDNGAGAERNEPV